MMSAIEVREKPLAVNARRAAAMISSRRASRCASLTFGIHPSTVAAGPEPGTGPRHQPSRAMRPEPGTAPRGPRLRARRRMQVDKHTAREDAQGQENEYSFFLDTGPP